MALLIISPLAGISLMLAAATMEENWLERGRQSKPELQPVQRSGTQEPGESED